MESSGIMLDPETEFLLSKRETGNEWELFKENVRPLKRGRKVEILNGALKSHNHNHLKKSLLDQRRRLIEAIDEYKGNDPLQPWLDCIKWVQEVFPPGGDCSGLVLIYEQCVRTFWHSDRYKDDLRYLKVWLEYAEICVDAEVIYSFLNANEIGKTHAVYYIAYASHMESKNKMKMANEILNLGISREAQPIEKLKDAYRKFLSRSMRRPTSVEEDRKEKGLPNRSFGTVLTRVENRTQMMDSSNPFRKNKSRDRGRNAPLSIYKDSNAADTTATTLNHQPATSKTEPKSWQTLASRGERNKENNAIPTKWTSFKVPQRPGSLGVRASASASIAAAHIEVFVDEECKENRSRIMNSGGDKALSLQLRQGDDRDLKKETELLRENPFDDRDLKKETELLRENPLRNFPPNSLPR